MALQYEVEDVSELDEGVQSLYEKGENGKYRLQVEGIDDGAELKEALRKEREDRKTAKEKLKALEDEKREAEQAAEQARLESAKKNGDVEALEKSWQEKLDSQLAEKDQELEKFRGMVSGLTVGQTAALVSADVFGEHAELMQHHVESRLTYELTNEGPQVRVLDPEGKMSAMGVEDLKKEFKGNKKFAPFVVGTKASGPGGHGGDKKGGDNTITRSEFDKLDPANKTAFMKKGGKVVEDE